MKNPERCGINLKRINEFLYDDIGNTYDRKNLYLKEIAQLYDEYDKTKDKKALDKIKKLRQNKQNHPYIIKLNDYLHKEKKFNSSIQAKKSKYIETLPKNLSGKMKQLKVRLYISGLRKDFYKEFVDISYEAQYEYEKAIIEVNQLPSIIEHLDINENELKTIRNRKDVSNEDKAKSKEDFNDYRKKEKEVLQNDIIKLKKKRKDRQISKKALNDGISELKIQYKANISVKSYELPEKNKNELIKNKKFEINSNSKRKRIVLNANISDLRRKTPVEVENKIPYKCFLTFLIPGLGQLLNKQYIKAALFLLVSFFVYVVAIPYALGFGNYQGNGIAGLVSLAQGGRKIDKSLIFLIEGIIAIFLVVIAVILIYISFRDVHSVEKNKIKGIRPNNWFETKTCISEEGFPYIVSLPALLVTIFIVLVPITTAILLSFTGMDPKHQSKFSWIGLKNYKMIVLGEGIAGSAFWLILWWTIIWTLVATSLAILIGFFLAILVNNERIKGKVIFRSIYLLPWAVPAFITIMFFSIMFSPNGALTDIISSLFGRHIVVKNDPNLSRITIILIQAWLGSSYIFLLSTGVLQAIPGDLYEAAVIDGATAWQKLKRITLPIVLFQTAPLLVGQYTFNFNNFSIIYLFNSGGPFNPSKYGNLAGTTDLLISYIFKLTTENQYQAIGAAITVFISLGLMLFAFIGFKNSKAFKEEKL